MAIKTQFKIPVIGLDITGPLIGKNSSASLDKIIKTGYEHIVINVTKNGTEDIKGTKNTGQISVTYLFHLRHADITEEFLSSLIIKTIDTLNLPVPNTIVLHIGPNSNKAYNFIDRWTIFKNVVSNLLPSTNVGFVSNSNIDEDITNAIKCKLSPDVLFVNGHIMNISFIEFCKENSIDVVSMITGSKHDVARLELFSKKFNAYPYHIIMRWMIQRQGIKIVIMDRESADEIIERDYLKVTRFCLGPRDFDFIKKCLPCQY